jgi:hypothetical protein
MGQYLQNILWTSYNHFFCDKESVANNDRKKFSEYQPRAWFYKTFWVVIYSNIDVTSVLKAWLFIFSLTSEWAQ